MDGDGPCYLGDGYAGGRELRVPCVVCSFLFTFYVLGLAAVVFWRETLIGLLGIGLLSALLS